MPPMYYPDQRQPELMAFHILSPFPPELLHFSSFLNEEITLMKEDYVSLAPPFFLVVSK